MKNKNDVFKIFDEFQKIIINKPSVEKMTEELRMMKFKIRPIYGNILTLNLLNNPQFIEALWNLGKLDELFQKEYRKLKTEERNLFFRLFENIRKKFQEQLITLDAKQEQVDKPAVFEIEVYREISSKKTN